MRSQVGGVAVEITRPESAKFRHPLLLLHGLWTDTWLWDPFAAYLAHRGWESWAPSLHGRDEVDLGPVLEPVLRALPNAPVVVAHDTGILAAASCAARASLPAVVTVAPVVAPAETGAARGIFAWPQYWRVRLGATRVPPPRGAGAEAFLGGTVVGERLRADSGARFRAIASGRTRLPSRLAIPGLVVGGGRGAIVPAPALRALATRFGWTALVHPARGHFLLVEPGWENVADEIHRWVVRTLGAGLLAFLDEDADPL